MDRWGRINSESNRPHGRGVFARTPAGDRAFFGTPLKMLLATTLLCVPRVVCGQSDPKPAPALTGKSTGPVADDKDPRVEAAVKKAAAFLRATAGHSNTGELALMVHALAKTRSRFPEIIADDDPVLREMAESLASRCRDGFQPTLRGGQDNYEAACAAMALAACEPGRYSDELKVVAKYLLGKQQLNGAWNYDGRPGGDSSMTQFALLGLWEASNAGGGPIPKEVWDRAAIWLTTRQCADGGFTYHPTEPGPGVEQPAATHTMTVGSLGGLYLCRDLLRSRPRSTQGVLRPVGDDEQVEKYTPQVRPEAITNAIDLATLWVKRNLTFNKARGEGDAGGGRWFYYYLYGFERFATLADFTQINDRNWYAEAAAVLLPRQQQNGSWTGGHDEVVDTCFATLCLVRSTRTSRDKARNQALRGGTLIFPGNLDEILRDGARVRVKPVRGPNGNIIDIIVKHDAAAEDGWELLVNPNELKPGLFKGPIVNPGNAASPDKLQLLRLALQKGVKSKDTLTIKTALRGLAFTGDYQVVPLLIDAMYYEDSPDVQLTARKSLCLISRKPTGFGYSDNSSAEEWQAEIDKWQAWYRTVRPESKTDD